MSDVKIEAVNGVRVLRCTFEKVLEEDIFHMLRLILHIFVKANFMKTDVVIAC